LGGRLSFFFFPFFPFVHLFFFKKLQKIIFSTLFF